jgi:dethiobiotin synthetase
MAVSSQVLFVTGTDTGVGKTVFTGLLLRHLRGSGLRALAMKPFCSGSRADVQLLQSLQPGELAEEEMNPYYFRQPIAPLVAREAQGRRITPGEVIASVRKIRAKCDVLLIEGSGGLLVPLARGFLVADLIDQIDCKVLLVARNRLGTINHTLLTVRALQAIDKEPLAIVMMSDYRGDFSAGTNSKVLSKLLKKIPIFPIPFLGKQPSAKLKIKAGDSAVVSRILAKLRSVLG